MTLLTEQEIEDIAEDFSLPYSKEAFARAIEAKARANLLEEIKANGPVKAVAVMVSAVGSTYKTPAEDYYRLSETA